VAWFRAALTEINLLSILDGWMNGLESIHFMHYKETIIYHIYNFKSIIIAKIVELIHITYTYVLSALLLHSGLN